jgi:ribosomal protein S18 acetylase RimI-like enzyme
MYLAKESLDAVTLAKFDFENFEESHRMDASEWQQMLSNGRVEIYTARTEKDQLVAVLVLKTSSVETERWYFYSIAVTEKFRKLRLATKLFHLAIENEIAVGVINSHCHVDNEASIALHKSLGFKTVQYVTDFYGDYEDAIMWERPR